MTDHTNGRGDVGALKAALLAEMERTGCRMMDLTVLDDKNDPVRKDTPANHRDAKWFIETIGDRVIHNRGVHYMALGLTKPDGTPYENTHAEWKWIQSAGRAARWLVYIPFDQVTDERNSAPVMRIREREEPNGVITLGGIHILVPEKITPSVRLDGWQATQPYRIAMYGEKTSLEPVLAPLSDYYGTDLLLPTGESSDVMIHALAETAAADGRPLVVLYFSDCDPSGRQMAVSVAWKLTLAKILDCPDLDFQVYPAALTVEQVRDAPASWGIELPSSPLKPEEKRADRWREAFGIEQTEIDAIATLHPDLLTQVARDAIRPWFDVGLERRMREVRQAWEKEANRVLVDQVGADQLAQLRREAEEKIEQLHELREEVEEAMYVDDLDGVELPPPPDPPDPVVKGVAGHPPLVDSGWGLLEQARALKRHKSYGQAR